MVRWRYWQIWLCVVLGGSLIGLGCQSTQNDNQMTTPVPVSATPTAKITPTLLVASAHETATATATISLSTATATAIATVTETPQPTITPLADSGWELLTTGLERRTLNLYTDEGVLWEELYILRLDPTYFQLDVGYSPGESKLLAAWQAESGAMMVINGGFFTAEQTATALVIQNSTAVGNSYIGFGGMVGIDQAHISILDLAQTPYTANEAYIAGMQSFPMLVKPGGEIGFPAEKETGRRARRTVIAKDVDGQLLFLITPRGGFTLHELSRYLVESDLALDVALNLDGGPSSGILLVNGGQAEGHASYTAVPLVFLVYPR